jgi:hypothetical protein
VTLADDTEEEPADTVDSVDTEHSADRRDPVTDPAFSYEEAQQRPFYAREETIGAFDSWLNYDLERELDQRGYENIVVREMTDALLRTVVEADLVEEVVERFEAARESAPSESEE